MPLKKPSDLFNKESPEEEIYIPQVEVSEENFDNVFNVFNTYKDYLNDFDEKLKSVNVLSNEVSSLKEEIEQTIKKEDLDKAILSQLLYVNQSIENIQKNVKAINEEKLDEIREDANNILGKVEEFIDKELPQHRKKIVEFNLQVEEQVKKSEETSSSVLESLYELEGTFRSSREVVSEYDNRLETVEDYLKNSKLEDFKDYIGDRVSRIRLDVNQSEDKIRRQSVQIETVRKDIHEALKTLNKDSLKKEIDAVLEANSTIVNSIESLKEETKDATKKFDEEVSKIEDLRVGLERRNISFSRKIEKLEKLYETIEINNRFIQEKVENPETSDSQSDPLLKTKFATLQDLKDHYRLFINRIQQQLSTVGGGGGDHIREMNDFSKDDRVGLNTNSADYDSKFITYNDTTKKFELTDEVKRFIVNATNPGAGTTFLEDFVVEGDARVVGVLTIGTASITLDAESGSISAGDVEVLSPGGGASYIGTVVGGSFKAGIATGDGIGITTNIISGPEIITIDPSTIGDNTGTVKIKGDLIVEGTETKIESQTLEIVDKTIGIASTSGSGGGKLTNLQLDGAGIIIHGSEGDKTLTWNNSDTRLAFNTDIYAPNISGNIDATNITSGTISTSRLPEIIPANLNIRNGISTIGDFEINGGIMTAVSGTAVTYYGDGSQLTGIEAGQSPLGISSDNTFTDGAIGLTSETKIVNAFDELNELALNMMKNTAVSQLDFSTGTTAGGSPFSITLATSAVGNPNSYYIDWGDGNTETTTDSTPSHTYTQPNGGQFSIEMTASNTAGVGAGSSFSKTRTNYITVYTPDPVVSFDLYRNSSGGSILSGNDLYVIEGHSLYLDNNTTNTTSATVDYTMNWGDGSSNDSIANDAADGGVSGSRLQHTWGQSNSGTGRDTLTLTLNNHNTANPAVIPTNGTSLLKVYDDSPTAPNGLSTKTLSNVTSTGTSPKLAHGFTDNTGGSTITAGDSVVRVTSGTAQTPILSSFAYNADSGTLSAKVNGNSDGDRVLSGSNDSGTYSSLIITSESDYQLLNSSGSSVSFSNSTYYPGFAKGFKARVSKTVSSMSTGANSYQLSHSSTGDTNVVEFVKDDLTSNPTVNSGGVTLSENVAGTYRYVSGIPYYNSGSPSITVSGVTISNLVGQCYTNQNDIFTISNESGSPVSSTNYTYAQIDGATTMLSGGVPIANTGTSTPYAIGSLVVPITSSSVRTVGTIRGIAKNVNGTGSTRLLDKTIQVHKSAQSGISEIAINVSNSLGSNYTDDGVRIFDFGVSGIGSDTPSYNGSTNFYTNNVYTESSDPGISNTTEAVVRLGNITHDTTDYSADYLPAGPDLSSNRSGTQYFTFAFRRQTVANFDINITSSGIAGLWIAAPGTDIDSTSGLNGWLRADTTYAGNGTPGSGSGGNTSDGCALTTGDRILTSTSLSGGYTMTLGNQNMSDATGNVVLVRIALGSGQSVTSLSIGVAA